MHKKKIVILAVGEKYIDLSRNLIKSLKENHCNEKIIIFGDVPEIRNTAEKVERLKRLYGKRYNEHEFGYIKKLFQLSKCNDVDTKYLYLDADMIALENPSFIFEKIKDEQILCNILKYVVNSTSFKDFNKCAEALNIANIPPITIQAMMLGFTGSMAYIFKEAFDLYTKYDFAEYGNTDSVYLTLACQLKNIKLVDIDEVFGRVIIYDPLFNRTSSPTTLKHFTRMGIDFKKTVIRNKL